MGDPASVEPRLSIERYCKLCTCGQSNHLHRQYVYPSGFGKGTVSAAICRGTQRLLWPLVVQLLSLADSRRIRKSACVLKDELMQSVLLSDYVLFSVY